MSVASILAPVFVLVLLVYGVLAGLCWSRTVALARGATTTDDVALGQKVWPPRATQFGNSYVNQFELPVLFFALVPLVMVTRKADLLFVILEWLFVLFRVLHALIHTTSNTVSLRGPAFLASSVVLAIAWIMFGFEILAGA
ncbi:MAPEG family protein [Lichenihabitans sp. PAMC28606]|uniref:MAPEG family protein n=1 Tax=Lichenihabitans sp. PAMC28606 TaxID=2880932 RepID=UPI001D0AE619|nr:MAPEG family protein [Lichenihabitans sp. PAMC28606]UDL95453.1 MAPEG family protein [Lichenihabitans sp. PAMC28606]